MLVWEEIQDDKATSGTFRAKVIGGWLVKSIEHVHISLHEDMRPQDGYEWRVAMCFVPDANHEWIV